jgi:hypothetical protein
MKAISSAGDESENTIRASWLRRGEYVMLEGSLTI